MLSPQKTLLQKIAPSEETKLPVLSLENEVQNHLLKDFKTPVTQNDFIKIKDEPNKNFGFLDEVISLLYKNNKYI